MINIVEVIQLYEHGQTLEKIGNKFGVTKQRIWQILKPHYPTISKPRPYYVRRTNHKSHPRPEEIRVISILKELGMDPIMQGYSSSFDILVNNKRVEIKYRASLAGPYKFSNLYSKEKVDYYIFIAGDIYISPTFYVIPADKIKKTLSISTTKKKGNWKSRYINRWNLLK